MFHLDSTRRVVAAAAVLGLVALMVGAGGASAATPPITFEIDMFDNCFAGRAVANQTVHIRWRDSVGAAKQSGDTPSDSYGRWQFCASDASIWVAPRDRIKATVGSYTRKYVVPNLTAHVDRVLDMATGTGPAGRTIRVCSTWALFGDYVKCHSVRVGQDGTWSYAPGHDIGVGIWVDVNWKSPNNDRIYVYAVSGNVIATIGKSSFAGSADPRQAVTVMRNASASGDATGDRFGEFSGSFRNASNTLVKVKVGDHITAPDVASDVDFVVPQIDVSVDKVNDVVSGTCHDAGTSAEFVFVKVVRSGGHVRGRSFGSTDSNGSFSLDFHELPPFGGSANIKSGDRVFVGCEQIGGDLAQLKLIVP
jgi:hypothetical protein